MGDLDLPRSQTYGDTYGAGRLSSDGRWWAGPTCDGMVALDLATGVLHALGICPGTWIRGKHAILTCRGNEIAVPGGRKLGGVPYQYSVGFEPDGTPLSLVRGRHGQAVLIEWRGASRHTRADVPVATAPRFAKPPGSRRRSYYPAEITGLTATTGQFTTVVRRGPHRLMAATVDSLTGETIGELTWDERDFGLTYADTWLDGQTVLIAADPYFVAWRPSTGDLFRVTNARSITGNYWDVSHATDVLAR